MQKLKDGMYGFTADELLAADEESAGYCLACGAWRDGCEPDAERYKCEECGKREVYGAGQLAIIGRFSHE
jgi:hypothetical protein